MHFNPEPISTEKPSEDLKRSILTNGLIQPVTVRKVADNSYELISEREDCVLSESLATQKSRHI
ncbi:MAG: ParB N-terminal domain-containing protein [Ignavibacteriales bacterium]|nr:ParB N-terminal domain-containing protein [Ignavibacteriales bacterium]